MVDNCFRDEKAGQYMQFRDFGLNPHLIKKLEDKGFLNPTPIQEKSIPLALGKKDIIACAKTGSGKTLAYLLPILHELLGELGHIVAQKEAGPFALVLAPTRELALQIHEEARYFLEETPLKSLAIFGGMDYEKQKQALKHNPELVVATPGRLIDFIQSQDITLNQVQFFVLDEADRMLDMGFLEDVKFILEQMPQKKNIQLFSATLNYEAIYSLWPYMQDPEEIFINPELIDHSKIEQKLIHLGKEEKLPYLIQFLEENKFDPVIVFTNTKNLVAWLVKNFNYHNIPAQGLSSTVNQKKRLEILEGFKNRKFRVLVATDVASRGLHIENVQLVVNFDIPQEVESYVHRIGRTARAGKSGFALSICSELDYENLDRLEKYLKYKIPVIQPEEKYLENLSFVKIVSPELKPRLKPRAKKELKKTQHPRKKLTKAKTAYEEKPILAKSLKKEKSLWEKILHLIPFFRKKRPVVMSAKTKAYLEREARLQGRKSVAFARRQKKQRSHFENRRKK